MNKQEKIDTLFEDIPQTILASELPDKITAKVDAIRRKPTQYGDALEFTLILEDNTQITTSYRIPKTWTGRGQMDMLKNHIATLGMDSPMDMVGRKYKWQRKELEGSVKGYARHYPTEEAK